MPRWLSPVTGAALGIAAYQLEKKLTHPVHPRFGRKLGYTPEFVRVRDLAAVQPLRHALMATSGVPPFMPVTLVGGRPAFDGGLVDNVPVEPLADDRSCRRPHAGAADPRLQAIPAIGGRTYTQPSAKIGVGQFDITNPDGIRTAYELGLKTATHSRRRSGRQVAG